MFDVFRFPQTKAYFHLREIDGVIGACRMALHKQYPSFALNGFKIWMPAAESEIGSGGSEVDEGESESKKKVVPEKLPVIYISQCTSPGWADACLRQVVTFRSNTRNTKFSEWRLLLIA